MRSQGELTRYWILNGEPMVEQILLTYAPNDWRACTIPPEIHARFAPELKRLAAEIASNTVLVDGDGNPTNPEPEAVVNSWLVEARAYSTTGQAVEGELLLEDMDSADPLFHDVFKRKPRDGAKQVSVEKYQAAVARRNSAAETEIERWASEHYALAKARHEMYRNRLGAELARDFLGELPTRDQFVKQAQQALAIN